MKKLIALAAIVFGLPACDLITGNCGEPATYYDVQGLGIGLGRQPAGGMAQNVVAGEAVASAELRLQLLLREQYYSAAPAPGLISAAYACDPVLPGQRGSTERVDSLSITSAFAYDAAHPAGAELRDLLLSDRGPQFAFPTRQSPQEPFRYMELRFRTPPAAAGTQQFRVYYRQTNGEVYRSESVTITLLP